MSVIEIITDSSINTTTDVGIVNLTQQNLCYVDLSLSTQVMFMI